MQAKQKLEKYGLKTLHSLKEVKEPSIFEKELIAVVKDIKFRNARSDFHNASRRHQINSQLRENNDFHG